MGKKSAILATLLAGITMFGGCNEKSEEKTTSKIKVDQQKINEVLNTPIYLNEMPHAMVLPSDNGGYVQLLYPARREGMVVEDKVQYEKRIKWLNEHDLVDIPQGHTLAGCRWKKRSKPSTSPFVSFFDNKDYIYQHINWMNGFYGPKNHWKVAYSPEKDPVVLWWVAQTEFHQLDLGRKISQKAPVKKQHTL